MCNCISEVEDKLNQAMDGLYKGKPINKISLNKVIPFNFQEGEISSPKIAIQYEIKREGVSRNAKEKLIASYCPFCGEQYDGVEL